MAIHFSNYTGGIASAYLHYRTKGSIKWDSTALISTGVNNFFGNIPASPTGNQIIEYYLSAKSNNGKTMYKPMPAPKGFFTFTIGNNTNTTTVANNRRADIDKIYPIPATSAVHLSISNPTNKPIEIKLIDAAGRILSDQTESNNFDSISIDMHSFPSGIYFVEIFVDGVSNSFRKITKL